MTTANVKTGVWTLEDTYLKINAGYWTYSANDTPPTPGPQAGTLWVWGSGQYGNLGVNNQTNYSSPVQVPGTEWTCMMMAGSGSIALKCDGTLWNWGTSTFGVNTTANYLSSPIQIPGTSWCKIAVDSGLFKGAIKNDGTLWMWGFNNSGRLGDNTTIARSSPTQVAGTSWTDVVTGFGVSSALKSDGTLWTWGYNGTGAMGNNNTVTPASSPVQLPGTAWCFIARRDSQASAIKTDGTLWRWGPNNCGALGNSTTLPNPCGASSPVQVPGTSWVEISHGNQSSIARKTDGTIWSWGYNGAGRFGNNSDTPASSPVQVPGTAWVEVQAANQTTLARKSDNTLWVWGQNYFGQFGNNTAGLAFYGSSPVQVPGSWIDIGRMDNTGISARKSV